MKNSLEEQNKRILSQIKKNVANKKWNCICENCNEPSINSHLLQQNGILSEICEDGHLIQSKVKDPNLWDNKELPFDFKKVGKSKALSKTVFCKKHDTELFKSIEQSKIDVANYHTQLLLSYRAACAEYRTKEIIVEELSRGVKSKQLSSSLKELFEPSINGNKVGLRDLDYYINHLKNDIDSDENQNFDFVVIEYPKLKLCISYIFNLCNDIDKNNDLDFILPMVLFHFVPVNDKSYIIIGYHKDKFNDEISQFIDSWKGLDINKLGIAITNLLAFRIEFWVMAPSLFDSISKSNIEKFQGLIECGINELFHTDCDFNLFQGLL